MHVTVVAILTIADRDAFRAYEARAATIMARHGGAIERAIAIPPAAADADARWREVHVLRFTDDAAFAAYRADPELRALAAMRAAAITGTAVLTGHDLDLRAAGLA